MDKFKERLANLLKILDLKNNSTIDIKHIGHIIRYLGFHPAESDVNKIVNELRNNQKNLTYVSIVDLSDKIMEIYREQKCPQVTLDELLKAFLKLNAEKNGVISLKDLSNFMNEFGEPFTSEELQNFLCTAREEDNFDCGKYLYKIYKIFKKHSNN